MVLFSGRCKLLIKGRVAKLSQRRGGKGRDRVNVDRFRHCNFVRFHYWTLDCCISILIFQAASSDGVSTLLQNSKPIEENKLLNRPFREFSLRY